MRSRTVFCIHMYLIVAFLISACAAPPELIGIEDPRIDRDAELSTNYRQLLIATSRLPSPQKGQFYSSQRSAELKLASVWVSLPPEREPGEIRRPMRLPPDARHEATVVDPVRFEDDASFLAALNKEIAARPANQRDVMVFVHGYNNTLSDAVLRVAQFVEDSGFEGVPVLFSWASAGRISKYAYDLNSVLAARPLLEQASSLIVQSNATGFDVFAHSLGAVLVTEVMVQSELRQTLGSSGRLKNVLLAAPDIDIDVFKSQMAQVPNIPGDLYILTSDDDFALGASRRVAGGIDRVGAAHIEELAGLDVTVIDLSKINDSASGSHSKFAGSPEVVQLIGRTLQTQGYSEKPSNVLILNALNLVPDALAEIVD